MILPDDIDNITVDMMRTQEFIARATSSIYAVDRAFILNNINNIDGVTYINNRITKDYKIDKVIRKRLYQLFNTAVEDWLSSRTLDKHILPGYKLEESMYPKEAQTLRKPIKHIEDVEGQENITAKRKKTKKKSKGKYGSQVDSFVRSKGNQGTGNGKFTWKFKYTKPSEDK